MTHAKFMPSEANFECHMKAGYLQKIDNWHWVKWFHKPGAMMISELFKCMGNVTDYVTVTSDQCDSSM